MFKPRPQDLEHLLQDSQFSHKQDPGNVASTVLESEECVCWNDRVCGNTIRNQERNQY